MGTKISQNITEIDDIRKFIIEYDYNTIKLFLDILLNRNRTNEFKVNYFKKTWILNTKIIVLTGEYDDYKEVLEFITSNLIPNYSTREKRNCSFCDNNGSSFHEELKDLIVIENIDELNSKYFQHVINYLDKGQSIIATIKNIDTLNEIFKNYINVINVKYDYKRYVREFTDEWEYEKTLSRTLDYIYD
jgi:hypothetical protein